MKLLKQEWLKILRSWQIWVVVLVLVAGFGIQVNGYMDNLKWVGGDMGRYLDYAKTLDGKVELTPGQNFAYEERRMISSNRHLDMPVEELMRIEMEVTQWDAMDRLYRWRRTQTRIAELLENPEQMPAGYEGVFTDQLAYMQRIGEPDTFIHARGIQNILYDALNIYGVIFICCSMILLLSAPIFSGEYAGGMTDPIASAKLGRNATVYAKCAVALIASIAVVSVYYIGSCVMYLSLYGDWDKLAAPARFISSGDNLYTDMTVGGLLGVGYLNCLAGTFALVAILCLLSAGIRSTLASVLAGAVVIFVPLFLINRISIYFSLVFPSFTMATTWMYSSYYEVKLFGLAMRGATFAPIVSVLIGCVGFALCGEVYSLTRGLGNGRAPSRPSA